MDRAVQYIQNRQRTGVLRALGIAGAAGVAVAFGTLIAMHFLQPWRNDLVEYVSQYANGPYGALFAFSLVVHGIGNGAMAFGFLELFRTDRRARAGALFLLLAAVGIVLSGAFFADPAGSMRSVSGTIHSVAAFIAFPIEVIAAFLLAGAFSRAHAWKSFAQVTNSVAWISVGAFLLLLTFMSVRIVPGLAERIAGLPLLAWEFFAGIQLARSSEA